MILSKEGTQKSIEIEFRAPKLSKIDKNSPQNLHKISTKITPKSLKITLDHKKKQSDTTKTSNPHC
jgi:hypothetical protein